MTRTVADFITETLQQAGVKRVFGVVGDSLNGFTWMPGELRLDSLSYLLVNAPDWPPLDEVLDEIVAAGHPAPSGWTAVEFDIAGSLNRIANSIPVAQANDSRPPHCAGHVHNQCLKLLGQKHNE